MKKIVLLVFILIYGCASLTPAQRTLWAIDIYLAEYDAYLEAVIDPSVSPEIKARLKTDTSLITPEFLNPKLTDETRKMLRVKKEILIEMKPLVLLAEEYQRTGVLPTKDVTDELTKLANRLVTLGD